MNPVDLGVIAIVVLSAIFAFARGFVREALSIVAWVGAAAITLYGFTPALAIVNPITRSELLSDVIVIVGLFVGSLIILTIATSFLARMVSISGLSPIDRTLGFIFGAARGAFILCLLYMVVHDYVPVADQPVWIRDAKSKDALEKGANMIRDILPNWAKMKSVTAQDAINLLSPETELLSPETEAKKAMRALATPGSPAPTKSEPAPTPGYRPAEQRELNRIIGTQR